MKKQTVISILLFFRYVTVLLATDDSLTVNYYRELAKEARLDNDVELSISLLKNGLAKCKTPVEYKLIYNSLGSIYFIKTDYHTARAYYDSAYVLLDKDKDSILQAHLYNNYGIIYMQFEEYDKAIEYYSLATEKMDTESKGILLYNIAKCYEYLDKEDLAIEFYKKSYAHNKKYLGKVNYYTALAGIELIRYGDLSKIQQLNEPVKELKNNYISSIYYYYIGNYEKAKEYSKDNNYFSLKIYAKTEQWYNAVSMIDTIRNSYHSIDSKLFLQKNEMQIYKHAIDDTLKTNIKQAFRYAQKSYGNILRDVSGYHLSDSKDSYNYFDFDSVIYLFILSDQQFEFHKIKADSVFWGQFHTFMNTYQPSYKGKYYENYMDFLKSGNYLFRKLLPKTDKNMLIVSNGRLQHLPFECLPTHMPADTTLPNFKTVPYLIKEATIHYDYVLRDYEKPKGRKMITALAPDTTLLYSIEEVKALKLFKSDRYIGKNALMGNINHGDILHIASHYNPKDFNIRFYDSTLNLNSLKKTHRDMVVLSTCLSGDGQYYEGEGFISPAREFYAAGAESVLESSWYAADMSAYLIVWYFYKQLRLGENKAEALRKAKLKFLEETPHHYSHPFLWGNFRIYGNNYPIRMPLAPIISIQLKILGILLVVVIVKYLLSRNRIVPF